MSKRIRHIVEVVEEIQAERKRSSSYVHDIGELRRGAVSAVAERHGVEPETVADKFIRQLRPHINSTSDFDAAVERFLRGDPSTLIDALAHHMVGGTDARLIERLLKAPDR